MINLVILDIDGVMTDGTKVYDESHNVIYKKYCDRDFTAIKRLKDCGVSVCFLSGDKRINEIQKTRKAAVDGRTGALRRSRKKRKRKNCQQLTEAELLELSAEQDNLLSRAKEAFFPSGSAVLDLKTEV